VLHVICFVREDLAHRLQKYGPIFFKSLTENKILQLVELLIAKEWLEERLEFEHTNSSIYTVFAVANKRMTRGLNSVHHN
jgi:hypothetical protein